MNDRDHNIIVIGTNDGIYRAPDDEIGNAVQVSDNTKVFRLRRFGDEIYAATQSGLFYSPNRGKTWNNLNVPQTEVYSILQSYNGQRLYAGTHPAHLYISNDDGASWRELTGLQGLPSRDSWRLPRHRNEAHVRSLGIHPNAPGRIIAGIEVGGVHISEDGGETWAERRHGLHNDIHHVLIIKADEYIASTGGGLYRTLNAGRSWNRLDGDLDQSYFREAFLAGGRLYAAAARSAPPAWRGKRGADAALFESTDGGDTFQSVVYPGQPEDVILAWTIDNGNVLAGTWEGRILRRTTNGWKQIGSVPASVRSFLVT
jgi:photosystem II stability/assembly factor-like uncharacterized protein